MSAGLQGPFSYKSDTSFLSSKPYLDYSWCLKNKDKIINNGYADKKEKEKTELNKDIMSSNYGDDLLATFLLDNIDKIEI